MQAVEGEGSTCAQRDAVGDGVGSVGAVSEPGKEALKRDLRGKLCVFLSEVGEVSISGQDVTTFV